MGKTGAIPITDAVRKMRGTARKDRLAKNNPKAQPQGEYLTVAPRAPRDLMKEAKPHWRVLAKELVANRMLAESDLTAFRTLTEAYGMYTMYLKAGDSKPMVNNKVNQAYVQARQWHNRANTLAERFGLTPGARARVAPPAETKESADPWDSI